MPAVCPYPAGTKRLYKIVQRWPMQRLRRWFKCTKCYTNVLCLLGGLVRPIAI